MTAKLRYFTRAEWTLWGASVLLIVGSFVLFHQNDYLTLTASLIGATSLMLNAKGNPVGQALTIAFSLLYGYISLTCAYYGEMITYLGMTAPMSVFALVSWLRHPYAAGKAEVRVNRISRREGAFAVALSLAVTFVFFFIFGAAQPAVCGGVCRQRPGADCAVEFGGAAGFFLPFGRGLFCDVLCQRSLRLLQLVAHAAAAKRPCINRLPPCPTPGGGVLFGRRIFSPPGHAGALHSHGRYGILYLYVFVCVA